MRECKRCLLNNGVPGVVFSEDDICSVCHDYDKRWGNWERIKKDRLVTLEKMFDDCRKKKRDYAVLVPLSGGKDSTYALYVCRKRYNLKCLAVTWDNGFLSDHARENIKKVTDLLGVDHVYYRINWPLLKRLYRLFFLKTGMFCPVCMRGIQVATERAAYAFNIPLIIAGTCQRTEEYVTPEYFNNGDVRFFKEVLKGEPLEKEASYLLYQGDWKRLISYYFFWWTKVERVIHSAFINLPDYMDWDYAKIYKTITDELEWKSLTEEEEHGDCKVSAVVHYMRQKKFPALTPELLRYAKLVTAGIMSKEAAIKKVCDSQPKNPIPVNLEYLLSVLEINREEFEKAMRDPLRHMKFVKPPGRLWQILRRIKRLIFNKGKL